MSNYKDAITPNIREMVTQINKVGLSKLRRYCKLYHPRSDFDKAVRLMRQIARSGYTDAAYRFNVSKQAAHLTLKHYYERAQKAEKWEEPEEMAGGLYDE